MIKISLEKLLPNGNDNRSRIDLIYEVNKESKTVFFTAKYQGTINGPFECIKSMYSIEEFLDFTEVLRQLL